MAKHTRTDAELAALAQELAALSYQPVISVIVPVYNTDPQWLRACIESVRRQVYQNWELCLCDDASTTPATVQTLREYESDKRIQIRYSSVNGGISIASNLALETAHGEFVALLDHDDELAPDALAEIVLHLNTHPEADVIYSDEDKLDLSGARCDAFFKPDWSPEHFLTCMYTCHMMVVRRQLMNEVGGFRTGYEGAQDYDLLLRLMERTARIHHIPRVLYHWRKLPESTASAGHAKPWALDAGRLAVEDYVRRRGIEADVLPGGAPGLYRVRRHIRGRPLVSIVIPTAGRLRDTNGTAVDLLANAITSVVQKTSYDAYEFIIVADAGRRAADDDPRPRGHASHGAAVLEARSFQFLREGQRGRVGVVRRACAAVQRRPRSHLAGLVVVDARVLAGDGHRGRRRQAACTPTAGSSISAWCWASRALPRTRSISTREFRPGMPAAPSSRATTRRSPRRA